MRRLKQLIVEALFLIKEGIYDPAIFKAIFMAGGPGGGKTFVAGKTTSGFGLRTINSDDMLAYLLRIEDISLDFKSLSPELTARKDVLRMRAKDLMQAKMSLYLKGRLGLLIDGTGSDYNHVADAKVGLEKLGYDTYMIFVNTSLDVAMQRNQNRGRKIPDDIVKYKWKESQNNFAKYQGIFGSNFIEIDNSRNDPDSIVFDNAWKGVMKFVNKSVKNSVALDWMRSQGGQA